MAGGYLRACLPGFVLGIPGGLVCGFRLVTFEYVRVWPVWVLVLAVWASGGVDFRRSGMRSKGVQIGIVIAAVLLLSGSLWWTFFRGSSPVADEFLLIDVQTGDVFRMSDGRGIATPARHPETKEARLVRVTRDEESGDWVVPERRRSAVSDLAARGVDVRAVDRQTGKVLVEIKNIRRYRAPEPPYPD